MSMHWTEQRRAQVHVGEALRNRGWVLHGYGRDRSEARVDYYAPASWDGVATHPEHEGIVVGVKASPHTAERSAGLAGWPAFQATPTGKAWHVEKDGAIVACGVGLSKCASHGDGGEQGVASMCDAIERAVHSIPAASGTDGPGVRVEHDRDWTWLYLPSKPEHGTRDRLKGMGGRWGRSRGGWYFRRHVPESELSWLLNGTARDQAGKPPPSEQDAYEYLPDSVLARLPALHSTEKDPDPWVQAKYFLPGTNWTWYALEYSPAEETFFGLVDGLEVELGYFSLADLTEVRSPQLRLQVERDVWFRPTPLSEVRRELAGRSREPSPAKPAGLSGKAGEAEMQGQEPAAEQTGPTSVPLLPDGWATDDVQHLLEKLNDGPILVSDRNLGIPTIHDFSDVNHLGFGVMQVKTPGYTLIYDAGGAMRRTPSGKGWTPLRIEGDYAYDTRAMRAQLERFLEQEAGVEPEMHPLVVTLEEWLARTDRQMQPSGETDHAEGSAGRRALDPGSTSTLEAIVGEHRALVEEALMGERPVAADVLSEYPDLAAQAEQKELSRPPRQQDYQPIWMRTLQALGASPSLGEGGVRAGGAGARTETLHKLVVQNAVARGYPVPEPVRAELQPDTDQVPAKEATHPGAGRAATIGQHSPVTDENLDAGQTDPVERPRQGPTSTDDRSPIEPYTPDDVAEYTQKWDLELETGSVRTVDRVLASITRPGVLRYALERIPHQVRRERIRRRLQQLEKAA